MDLEKIRISTSFLLSCMMGRSKGETIVDDIENLSSCLEGLFHDLGWITEQMDIHTFLSNLKEEMNELPKSYDELEEILIEEHQEGYEEGCRHRSEEDYEEGYEVGYQKGLEEANKNTEDSQ